MNRRSYLASAVAGVVGASAGCAWAAETYRNPVFERVFADPTVVERDGSYYAYGTYQDWGNPGRRRLIPIIRSENLVDWKYVGEAFETKPDWRERGGLWAPDIGRLAGRYVLYYSYASFQAGNPGIGVATSNDPAGTFDDHGPLFRSAEIGVPHSIDPCLLVHRGTPFLFWGSHAGIYGIRLSDDGLRTVGGKFQVAGEGVEAAYVIRRGDSFYLFGSRGTCCEGAESTYRVVVGRANSLRGPYRNRDGENLLSATGTTILHGGEQFAGPGHCAVARGPDGDRWLLYHAYERSNPWVGKMPRRVLMLDRLVWRNGWPVVPGKTPSAEHRVPTAGR
ncbi:family 43 glycosylhydrolase [Haladaptatus salinisoli]|uniref:family 43 glycosylhydrolase n=1 Tax=Haladaptatus salinisoli TaxID=2884876 RepID=UPI001D0B75F5|nr:family 43 glycosylhydrolase [Haladaptatus salinisoli]